MSSKILAVDLYNGLIVKTILRKKLKILRIAGLLPNERSVLGGT